ncbi:hypothetical protein [Isoptericola aurantiacus]|uniref:hypothetical protein n=1 Tax=Isoptericola aurantiacus TaxID=3377839 RepID=UPI003839DC9B
MPTTRRRRVPRVGRAVCAAVVATGLTACGLLPSAGQETPGGSAPAAGSGPTSSPADDAPSVLPSFDPSSAVAQYATGFPVDLLRAPDGATVLASSATPAQGPLVDFSLNLATTASTQEVVDDYATRLDGKGFAESESVDVSGLDAQTAFSRTRPGKNPHVETVIIGVLDDGDRRLVSLSGTVRAPDD